MLPNFHELIKQNSALLLRNVGLGTFDELIIVFSTNVNLLYFLYSTAWRCCLLHLIEPNCLLKTFLRILVLITWISLYLFSPVGII